PARCAPTAGSRAPERPGTRSPRPHAATLSRIAWRAWPRRVRARRGRRLPGQGRPHDTHPRCAMSRVCQVTGKRTTTGNNVSHAMNKTRRRFMPNLHERRFWVASENRWVKLRVSTAALRTIDKNGIDAVLAELRKRGEKV